MQFALSALEVKARGSRNLDAELEFCRSALARGKVLAMQGQLESATRDVWVVKTAADFVKSFLAKTERGEGLDRLVIQLNEVQKGLNDLRMYLDIPPEAH
jgi:hypothetical protein